MVQCKNMASVRKKILQQLCFLSAETVALPAVCQQTKAVCVSAVVLQYLLYECVLLLSSDMQRIGIAE
jgi:hypothetical protein